MKLTKIALGVALASGAVAAQAAVTLWFPHVVHSGYTTTVLTVIDSAGTAYTSPEPQHMHYVYKLGYAGETADVINVKHCEESDGMYPFSKYDVQSFDVGGVLDTSGAGVLFNDPGVKNPWAGYDYRRAMNAAASAGAVGSRGYWIVEDADATALEGYATVFDYKTGSGWGYTAEVLGSATHAPVQFSAHLMPRAETISRLLITPYLDGKMIPTSAGWVNNLTVGIVPVVLDKSSLTVVNRDEIIESGTQSRQVTCVGTVDIWDLVAAGTKNHVKDGGWMKINTVAGASGTATANAVVYQLDFGGQGATNNQFNGYGYPGTWNNLTVRQ